MNTVTEARPASADQVKANVRKWRREHGLEPRPKRFINQPTFTHKGDKKAGAR